VFVSRALRREGGCRSLLNEKLHNLYSLTKVVVSDNIRKDETENGTCSGNTIGQ
jgi:hypothetical protein